MVYKNLGHARFKDVTAKMGLQPKGWVGDASLADLNGDGYPDLYVLNMQGYGHYYENEGGRKFVDKTAEYFPKTPWGSMGIKCFDYDNDGRLDLFLTDRHSDMFHDAEPRNEKKKSLVDPSDQVMVAAPLDKSVFGNALYHNLGGGKFEEVSDRMGVENYWPWGVSVADINADGWDDTFITSGMSFPFRYGINSMLLNNRGEKFLDAEFLLGIEPRRDGRTHTPWYMIDCSQSGLDPLNQQVCQGQSGKITVISTISSRSSAIFDLDNDGDLDIVTNDFNSEPMVLVSDLAQVKQIHWVKVVLVRTRTATGWAQPCGCTPAARSI